MKTEDGDHLWQVAAASCPRIAVAAWCPMVLSSCPCFNYSCCLNS
ncbi:MAG: hypothetical protein ABIJ30_11265 [bacterium]